MRYKKSLGQHFLTSPRIAEQIVSLSGVTTKDSVLEIGAGRGILTRALAARVRSVIAVEKDRALAQDLRVRFESVPHVNIVEGDILEMSLKEIVQLAGRPILSVVANLPYNIGSQVLFRLVEWRESIRHATVMLQKEVADRLVARPGSRNYGLLTVLIGLWAERRILLRVAPGSFFPRPRISSAVVHLDFKAEPLYDVGSSLFSFDRLVRAAFRARRKILRNTLSGPGGVGLDVPRCEEWLRGCGVSPQARAEELSIADFARLAQKLAVS